MSRCHIQYTLIAYHLVGCNNPLPLVDERSEGVVQSEVEANIGLSQPFRHSS